MWHDAALTQLTSPPQEAPLGETVVPDSRLFGAGGLRLAGILVEVVKTRFEDRGNGKARWTNRSTFMNHLEGEKP
ncbi:MAG: hypothetical protein OXH28_07510 [bacterium]|nr:hypothetical protein [bacterium]